MKPKLRYAALAALVACVLSVAWLSWRSPLLMTRLRSTPVYRTKDEILAIHRDHGWTVMQWPQNEKRYLNIGAICDNDRNSTRTVIEGSFRVEDGRTVSFEVPRPSGMEIDVEGLQPEDGGELQYAVLTRPHGHETTLSRHNQRTKR